MKFLFNIVSIMFLLLGCTINKPVVEHTPIKETEIIVEEPHCLYLIMTGEQAAANYWEKVIQNPAGLTEYAVNYRDKIAKGPGSKTLAHCFESLDECTKQKDSFRVNIQGQYSLKCVKDKQKTSV